jgi:tetratricopeptide (TPR) repeat protein
LTLWSANLALMLENNTVTARRLASQAAEAGRSLGLLDLEMLALAIEGLALVGEGEIADGMRRLDEAATAAVAGEMTDRSAVWTTLCSLMTACDRIRDYDRAVQWCGRVKELARQWRFEALFTPCRPAYASVLMWRGEWAEAEVQLLAAHRECLEMRPLMVVEGIVRLAELRWRQGRWEEAEASFGEVKGEGLALPGRAELALSQGDTATSIDLLDRYLRQIPAEDRMERAGALELMVRALAAAGELDRAEVPLTELRQIVDRVVTDPLKASANFATGLLAAARGDAQGARESLEDAVDLFERHRAPFEAARVRIELAKALLGAGRQVDAGPEAAMALQAFRRVGAAKEAERASEFLRNWTPRRNPRRPRTAPVSRHERLRCWR